MQGSPDYPVRKFRVTEGKFKGSIVEYVSGPFPSLTGNEFYGVVLLGTKLYFFQSELEELID
jgi:hypothetical protein